MGCLSAHVVTAVIAGTAVAELFLLARVLRTRPRTHDRILLSICLGGMAVFTVFAMFTFQAPSERTFRAFYLLSVSGLFLFYPATLDFAHSLARRRALGWAYRGVLYAPAALFYAASLLGYNVPFGGYHYVPDRWWVFEPQTEPLWAITYAGYGLAVMGITVLLLLRMYRHAAEHRRRRQAITVLVGMGISMVLQWSEFLIVPRLTVWELPSLTPLLAIPWVTGMYLAVQRHNLLDLHPEWIVEEAFDAVPRGIVLTDRRGRVSYANCEASRMIGPVQSGESPLRDRIPAIDEWMRDGALGEYRSVASVIAGQALVRGRAVADHYGDRLGCAFFLDRLPDNARMQQTFNLTPREAEVYRELLSGAPLRRIAASLNITERTVKAHVHAIYHKTGAANRTELVTAALSL